MHSRSAPTARASSAEAKSLSMTASTPSRRPSGRSTTGIPPPPAATTRKPASTSVWIASCSTIRTGCGEATSRRQPRPESSATVPPVLLGQAARDGLLVEAADRLRRRGERGVAGVDDGVREGRDDLLVEAGRAQLALQRRAEDVAEAPLGVGDRHVEVELRQPGLDVGDEVRAAHDEADLRAVAVRQDDPPAVGHEPAQLRGEPPGGVELLGDRGGAAALEEGVAPDGDDGGAGGGRHGRTVGRARARVMGWT